jgi:ABC-type antimicrobial peptide transport system permease subunit
VEVVGISQNGKYAGVFETQQPYLYLPVTPDARSNATLIATTDRDPRLLLPEARKAVLQVAPKTLISSMRTMTDHMQFATLASRLAVWLSASLGGLALLLTLIGLYGLMAYSVSRRTHEIGVRMALGALRKTVFISVLKDGLQLALVGVAIGIGLAMLLARAMGSLIYGMNAFDSLSFIISITVLLAASFCAVIGPARQSVSVDPIEALRVD